MNAFSRKTLAAGFVLALTFFGCSGGDKGDDPQPSPGTSSGATDGSSSSEGGSSSSVGGSSSSSDDGSSDDVLGSSSSEVGNYSSSSVVESSSSMLLSSSSSIEPSSSSNESESSSSIVDTYESVTIGTQVWMKKNLNIDVEGSRCYDDNPDNCEKYGRLYNWETALTVCPSGWKLPSDDDWNILVDFAGGGDIAGTELKATSGWKDDGGGTDNHGFAALPGGDGSSSGEFLNGGSYGEWWSASEYDDSDAYILVMGYNGEYAGRDNWYKTHLRSVRCLQD